LKEILKNNSKFFQIFYLKNHFLFGLDKKDPNCRRSKNIIANRKLKLSPYAKFCRFWT